MAEAQLPHRSFAIEVTARCNQRCLYCYNRWRADGGAATAVPTLADLQSLVLRLLDEAAPRHVTLTGGEPFSRPDLVEFVAWLHLRRLPVVIISNGGLLTAETARALAKFRVLAVQLTLAGGDAAAHDAICGSGAFAGVTRAFAYLHEARVPTSGSVLCTSQNAATADAIFARFAALGVRRLAFNRLNPSGYGRAVVRALMPTRSHVLQALGAAERFAAAGRGTVTNTMPLPPCAVDPADFPHVRFGQCAAGSKWGEPALGPDGDVRLCTLQRFALGNLRTTSLATLLASPRAERFRTQRPAFCADCPQAPSCLGGCRAAAEWAFGDACELDPFLAQHVMPDFEARLAAAAPPSGPASDPAAPPSGPVEPLR